MTTALGELTSRLAAALAVRRQGHGYRSRTETGPAAAPHIRVADRDYINFASNDYLGLSTHPHVVRAFRDAAAEYGVGAGASHLVTGHRRPHGELERALAALCGTPRALLFSTGYMANLGLVSTLCPRTGVVMEDRLNHASLLDAAALSAGRLVRYRHADADDLGRRLAAAGGGPRIVVTDGVFSMDGDIAPLPDLLAVARQHGAILLVDDAHAFGVLGASGAGTCDHFGIDPADRPVVMGTLGKAFGVFGAFVAGPESLVESLIQQARSYIYTTALPPAVAAAALAAVGLMQAEPGRRAHLHHLIRHLRAGARRRGLDFVDSQTPIQPFIVGGDARALALAEALRLEGFWVTAIRPPTVPKGTARLRVTLSAAHTTAAVDAFLDALEGATHASGD